VRPAVTLVAEAAGGVGRGGVADVEQQCSGPFGHSGGEEMIVGGSHG
jgi:hypothetical protein